MLDTRWSDAAPLTESNAVESDADGGRLFAWPMTSVSLDRLRQHFAPKMKDTPDANAVRGAVARHRQHGLAFRDAAAKIASVDTLQSFMKDFAKPQVVAGAKSSRKRSEHLSSPGGLRPRGDERHDHASKG